MSANDLITIPFEFLASIIAILIALLFLNKFTEIFNPLVGNTSAAANWSTGTVAIFSSMTGSIVMAVIVGLMVMSFVLAIKLPTSIIWTPMFALLTLIATWISVPIAQAYETIIANPTFAAYSTNMQVATLLMSYLPFIVLLTGCVLAVVTFMKFRREITTGI